VDKQPNVKIAIKFYLFSCAGLINTF